MEGTSTAKAADLLDDYKLKVAASQAQTERIQTQFQAMLTLESAIATALIVTNNGDLTKNSPFIAGLLLLLSVAWIMVGATGRRNAKTHRGAAAKAGCEWAKAAGIDPYVPVGQAEGEKEPPVPKVGVIAPALLTVLWLALTLRFAFAVY